MKANPVKKILFAISLIKSSCEKVKEQKGLLTGEDEGEETFFDLDAWLQNMHDAIILLRQTSKETRGAFYRIPEDVVAAIYQTKAQIHHTVGIIEHHFQKVSPLQNEGKHYRLEQMEMSLISSLECLAACLPPSEDKNSKANQEGIKQLNKAENSLGDLQKEQRCDRATSRPQGVLWDLFKAEMTVFSSIPDDLFRMFRRSPLTSLVLVLVFPLTLLIYVIVGVHECMQRRHLRQLFANQQSLHKKLKAFRNGESSYPSEEIDEYLKLLCPLGGRSYDFHFAPLFRGMPWKKVGDALAFAEEEMQKGGKAPVFEEVLEMFNELRLEVQQVYAGTFEDFEEEVRTSLTSVEASIKEREELVGYHLQHFENVLSEFFENVEKQQKEEIHKEEEETLAKYEDIRKELMVAAMQKAVELGLLNQQTLPSSGEMRRVLHQIELLAVIEELKNPSLQMENCPHDHEHSEMLIKIKKARQKYFLLDTDEVDHLIRKTLNPHYLVPRNLAHRIEVLKLSERALPLIARMLFQHPPFDMDAFLASSAVQWLFKS